MTPYEKDLEDNVMCAFLAACPRPTYAEIKQWQAMYPQYAEVFVEIAALALESIIMGDMTEDDELLEPVTPDVLERLMSVCPVPQMTRGGKALPH